MSPSARLLKKGQIFAEKYRIERFLAEGAMGAVFVAEHTVTAQQVAIKVLWTVKASDEGERRKALLEARISGLIRSEHVVQVIDAGFDAASGWLYIVMELLEGQTLELLVKRRGALPPQEVALYLGQVAAGLDRAHNHTLKDGSPQPIIHRDLKPENLFLASRTGGEPLVKILDFGIAKVTSQGASNGTHQPKGTPLYMSPEQLSVRPISPATDVWALGLIAYFLLSGRSYWRAGNHPSADLWALLAEISATVNAPSSASERIREFLPAAPWPPAFDGWFARCTAGDPTQRFPSAVAAARALCLALGVAEETALGALGSAPGLSLPLPESAGGAVAVEAATGFGRTQAAMTTTSAPGARSSPRGVPIALAAGAVVASILAGALILGKGPAPASLASVQPPSPSSAGSIPSAAPSVALMVAPEASASSPPRASNSPPAAGRPAPGGKARPNPVPTTPPRAPKKDPYE